MRKYLIPIAAAATALTVAAPAAAQWAPPVYRYQPYNYGNGFRYNAFANQMQARVQRVRSDIRMMAARRILSPMEARSLDNQARNVERHIWRRSQNGIRPGEARALENQIRNLEFRVQREAADWNRAPNRWRRH